ncbi:MAG: YbdK family carboxylate-amine ligase [Desulfobulbaceae bacterium]|nr:YbdK family carboxylate-amine ligase [Desulfobulbaceae bacterium]
MEPLEFIPSKPYTIGVELELQLLDEQSLDLIPLAPQLLARVDDSLKGNIKAEFICSMVEICTGICSNMTKVEEELLELFKICNKLTNEMDALVHAGSLHPFALVQNRHISPAARYSEILHDVQMAGRRLITQALHVHIGLPDADTTIRVCDTIRPFLPILLALTTSSPYFEGEDSGFYSYRTNLFKSLPRSGVPETIGSWKRFKELIEVLREGTILHDIKEIWWDVRPHPDFGTVEIRICDLPGKFHDILGVVALIQALVITLSKQEFKLPPFREVMLNNKWHASRYGLDGTYISPLRGRHKSFVAASIDLLKMVSDAASEQGTHRYLKYVSDILDNGTSAHFQRQHYNRHGDFKLMLSEQMQRFNQ